MNVGETLLGCKSRRAVAVIATMAATIGILGSPASADPGDLAERGIRLVERVLNDPSPKSALDSLTKAERDLFNATALPATVTVVESEPVRAPAPTAKDGRAAFNPDCWTRNASAVYKSLVGIHLYTYGNQVEECHFAGTTRSIVVRRPWNEVKMAGWREDRSPTTQVVNAGWEGRGMSQHYMILGAGGVDINRPTSCLQQRMNANGIHAASRISCNMN